MSGNGARRRHGGFSLVELLITTAIIGILGGTVIAFLFTQVRLSASQNRNMLNQESLRDTLNFMTDEISLAGAGATEPFISAADADAFQFNGDIDGNGALDRVRFDLVGSDLRRTLYSSEDGVTWTQVGQDVVLTSVGEFVLTYYGPGNTVDPDIDAITSVAVRLSLDVAATSTALTSGRLAPQAMTGRVTLRNRLL